MLKSLSGSYFNDIGDFCPEHTAACTGTAGVTAGSPAAWPTLAQYQIFGQNIFYPLIISPPPSFAAAALFAVRLFFLVGFSQSFVSNFSLGRQFLWHWMKIFLPTMTANWIHCAGMFPKFYLTFECRATMRQYLSLILSVFLFISQSQGGALSSNSSKHFARVTQIWKQFELCPVSRGVTRVVSRVTEDAPAL